MERYESLFFPSPPRFLDLSPKGFIDPPLLLPVASKWPTFWRFWLSPCHPPKFPARARPFLLSFSISSGKCHPRIYSFARLRRACSSHPYLSNSHFSWTSGRIKNRGGGFLLCTLRESTMVDRDLHGDTPWKIYPRPMASNTRGGVARQVPAVVQIDRTLKQGREGGWEGNERRSWGVAALANNSPP